MYPIETASVNTLIIYFAHTPSVKVSALIANAAEKIKQQLPAVTDLIPAYTSLLVCYDLLKIDAAQLRLQLEQILQNLELDSLPANSGKLLEIPVYYSTETGIDLLPLAKAKNLSVEEVIALHCGQEYRVAAIGFAPGFAYLGDLPEALAQARHSTPRLSVPAGSVAIANRQTAVYPLTSPGGWHLIGRTTTAMFDRSLPSLCPVKMGDRVRFYSISKEQFLDQGGQLKQEAV
ncbi:sensor histidine kinase inhibitor, KipI family [Oceanospirillum multiglobuliferum]|uniref:Carboxyltransferase domain-containing protein n=1 Tax=Oceanospirillum multiglobuliferum TaxID=64969 RepID=A0A1T4SHD2_9GAMM|nr:5-oxoprolinase subunit PxpB [Oceanospirillum multiglobuliferum]OPX54230.1 hypothetical protein BTE48_15300 [Oceanospirillum multiglobuliferum]SKA27632.1 sensor histidine kinase inhibitor, KipI family [Oceanospirillum multiglobuliferum]